MKYGECARHPGNNMVNCPLCSMEGKGPFPGTLRMLVVEEDAPPPIKVTLAPSDMSEAKRLLSTLQLTAEDSSVAGDAMVTTGELRLRWPDMDAAAEFFRRLNPDKQHVFPVHTYHLCVANWLVSAVCGTGELRL